MAGGVSGPLAAQVQLSASSTSAEMTDKKKDKDSKGGGGAKDFKGLFGRK